LTNYKVTKNALAQPATSAGRFTIHVQSVIITLINNSLSNHE
jgi:hypothetical protein